MRLKYMSRPYKGDRSHPQRGGNGRDRDTRRSGGVGGTVLIVIVVGLVIGFGIYALPQFLRGTNGTDGTNGTKGVVGDDGASGFNGTAADYTVYAAPDNSWYVAVPGIPSLPLYNETVVSILLDKTILALNGSIVRGGLIRVLKGYYPLTHAILLDPEVSLQGSGIFTILRAAGNFSAMISDQGKTAASG